MSKKSHATGRKPSEETRVPTWDEIREAPDPQKAKLDALADDPEFKAAVEHGKRFEATQEEAGKVIRAWDARLEEMRRRFPQGFDLGTEEGRRDSDLVDKALRLKQAAVEAVYENAGFRFVATDTKPDSPATLLKWIEVKLAILDRSRMAYPTQGYPCEAAAEYYQQAFECALDLRKANPLLPPLPDEGDNSQANLNRLRDWCITIGRLGNRQQAWDDEGSEYMSLSEARKLIDGRLSISTLSKLCKPDGEIRYMRKRGKGCKVYLADFYRYMKARQSDPKYARLLAAFMACEGKGDMRFVWKCGKCGAVVSKTADRCSSRDCYGHEPAVFDFKIEPIPLPKPRR